MVRSFVISALALSCLAESAESAPLTRDFSFTANDFELAFEQNVALPDPLPNVPQDPVTGNFTLTFDGISMGDQITIEKADFTIGGQTFDESTTVAGFVGGGFLQIAGVAFNEGPPDIGSEPNSGLAFSNSDENDFRLTFLFDPSESGIDTTGVVGIADASFDYVTENTDAIFTTDSLNISWSIQNTTDPGDGGSGQVPVPATLLLLCSGVVAFSGLGWISQRRQARVQVI
jgi:hypothetical protein